MANTYTLIASSTVGAGGVAAINFTSIPATYTDLMVTGSLRVDYPQTGGYPLCYQINGNTSGYTGKVLFGDGSTASSASTTTLTANGSTYGRIGDYALNTQTQTGNVFSSVSFYLPNYAASNNKSISFDSVIETNGTTVEADLSANLWSNSAAITSISFAPYNGVNFSQYSTMYLYGVNNA